MTAIKDKFDQDKAFLISQTNEFLQGNKPEPLRVGRDEVVKAVQTGNFTKALQELEVLREDRTGIQLTKIEGKDGSTPIIIRDAREVKDPRVLGTEGFEMQYLNTIRAAMEIAEIEGKGERKEQLQKDAISFIESFNKENDGRSQEEISINVKNKVNNIVILLENSGIADVHSKLNVAKDFQNLNDEHCNIVTLSNVIDSENKNHTVIEAEVALKGLTEEQKAEYESIKTDTKPKWFLKMPDWESKLVEQYADKITAGNHTISTHLRQIVGMKNAFEKITAIAEKDKPIEIVHTSKHAGTLASFSLDEGSQQKITELNCKQAQEWMGDHKLHANTLNSGNTRFILPHRDARIVTLTRRGLDKIGAYHTNTALNVFRKLASLNNFDGAKQRLNDVADNLLSQGNFKDIATHLKPRGKFERLFGINKPKGDLETMLKTETETGRLSTEGTKILTDAVNLRQDIEKADVFLYSGKDKENINADISRKLNFMSYQISHTQDPAFSSISKQEILTMCASGKDRTGLAEHDQSSSAIATKLSIEVADIDRQLLKAGHTAGQAGGVYAGGCTIGCYGTLSQTAQGFPESRKEALQPIIEQTGANYKIKKLEKNEIINEKEEQIKAQETPDMTKTEAYVSFQGAAINVAVNKPEENPKIQNTTKQNIPEQIKEQAQFIVKESEIQSSQQKEIPSHVKNLQQSIKKETSHGDSR